MAFKIPGIPDDVEDYLLCVLFHLSLPLLPVGIEFFHSNFQISESSSTLTASIYTISIGISSRRRLMFGFGTILSLVFAVEFCITLAGQRLNRLNGLTAAA
jgi:hypothetical protein